MKNVLRSLIPWGGAMLVAAIFLGGGACTRKAGIEDGFEYIGEGWSAELTGVSNNGGDSVGSRETGPVRERLEVPSRLGGKRVRSVAAGAFRDTEAVSVKIPWRVSRIGAEAFAGGTNLVWAELPSRLERVEDGLFRGCTRMEESDIPNRVEEIGARAYRGCTGLKRVALPPKLRSVGAEAFSGCKSLEAIELPASLGDVGEGAFEGCLSLKHLELPQGIANIPDGAFAGCAGLRSVLIPAGVTNIGARAFAGCESLERIELPAGLRSVGAGAFSGCGALARLHFPAAVEAIGERVCAGCGRLGEISVETGNACYQSREGGLLTKDGTALLACSAGLEGAFAIPDGVREAGDEAFANCGLLESVSIPASLERLGNRVFEGCTGLKSVDVAEDNPVFSSRDGVLFRDGGAELVFFPRARSGGFAVPEGVARIAADAFRGSCVEKVAVPGGVESIGESAFRDCRRLRRVELAEGVGELGDGAFAGCGALWAVTIPPSVGKAGAGLFDGCGELRVLVVPDDLMQAMSPAEEWKVDPRCTLYRPAEWEAERRNWRAEAASDPFFGLYGDENLDTVAFEGTVLDASAVPDPDRNDYDNCLIAILVEVDSMLSSAPPSDDVARVVLVNAPILKDRIVLMQNQFEPGDRISCLCAEYDAMPQAIREIQLSDDIQSFEHQQYYALSTGKIRDFRTTGHRDFAKMEITVLPVQSLPRDPAATASRRARIQGEIARIENELEEHGGSFEAWKEEYRPIAEEYGRLCSEMRKVWIGDSYFVAKGPETTYETRAFLDSLIPYKKYLEDNNVDLILLRIPTKWDFAARVLAGDGFHENPAWVEHYYECLKNDIEIVDPMPEMWKERFDFPLFYFYNVDEEFHPCEGMCFVGAQVLADVLERYPHQKSDREIVVTNAVFESGQKRFFWPAGNEKFDPSENIAFRQVFQDGRTIGNLRESTGSPFLFLSNSYFWFPQRPLGASLPGYAAYFLQALPDWVHQDGAHHNVLIRTLVSTPRLLDGRRVVIAVGDPGCWNGFRFPPLPKYIQDRARRISLEKTLAAFSDEIMVHDGGTFLHPVKDNGSVMFIQADTQPEEEGAWFGLEFDVPRMEGKRTCMIRLNFEKTFPVTVDLLDGDDVVLDTCFLGFGREQTADFFVPVQDSGAHAKIVFKPRYPHKECTIKNIGLWYY